MSLSSSRSFSSLIFLSLLAAGKIASADQINDWPDQKQIDSSAFEKKFISIFNTKPDDLEHTHPALVECDIDEDKARKLSGTNLETLAAPFKSVNTMHVEIDVDIQTLDIFSTHAGCENLKTLKLQNIQDASANYYKVPATFRAPLLINVHYYQEQEITMTINGEEHVTEQETEVSQQVVYLYPARPTHPDFPQETYFIMDMTMGETEIMSYHATFARTRQSATKVEKISLSHNETNGKARNTISLQGKNSAGQPLLTNYGKDNLITMVDGKMHGLFLSKNFMYETNRSLPPLSRACYDMGERIDIFRVTSDTECVAATEDQIGKNNVYMDPIYKSQRDLKKRLAAISEHTPAKPADKTVTPAVKAEQAKKKQQLAQFEQLSRKAKCKLKNSNWVYTAENCKDGYAEGEGSAEDRSGLKFIGSFKAGSRVKGEIHQNDEMIFSGELVDDKPSGNAICLFEKEYEECRFFRGKRIDTLYKVRKENAKNMARMEKMQLQRQVSATKAKSSTDHAVDALEKEGMKRAASFIFDQLF